MQAETVDHAGFKLLVVSGGGEPPVVQVKLVVPDYCRCLLVLDSSRPPGMQAELWHG